MPLRISAFPKCYLEDIAAGRMTVFEWIERARQLDADGLEMYTGFFTSFEPPYVEKVGDAIRLAGFAMPMLCCSPDFTVPDEDKRKREIEREAAMIEIARKLGGPGSVCRASWRDSGGPEGSGVHATGPAVSSVDGHRPRSIRCGQGRRHST